MQIYRFVFLPSDGLLALLILSVTVFSAFAFRQGHWRTAAYKIFYRPLGCCTGLLLAFFLVITLLDSIHFQLRYQTEEMAYWGQTESLLDRLCLPWAEEYEKTYSAPFALNLYTKESKVNATEQFIQYYPALKHVNLKVLAQPTIYLHFILSKTAHVFLIASTVFLLVIAIVFLCFYFFKLDRHFFPWWHFSLILWLIIFVSLWCFYLSQDFHVLGTGKVGQDLFYQTIKSIRTGVLVGTLTTLIMLPFAIFFGCAAGYFGGWVDDLIQYLYTTLSAMPGVLIIAAAILAIQIYMTNHEAVFSNLAMRSDLRLVALCFILGVSSWTTMCRLLRAETLKIRELDFVLVARTQGISHFKIIWHHIIPNVMHIILITAVLDFSGLVLAEAVLSYVGVGVDPTMISWGNMINGARMEMARTPIVWWPLFGAFFSMFLLVLCANLFSDVVSQALDPKG